MGILSARINNLIYDYRSRQYRKSSAWQRHPDNKSFPKEDWDEIDREIVNVCTSLGVPTQDLGLDVDEYETWKTEYPIPFSSFYALRVRSKKLIEHHIAFKLLAMEKGDRYMDIASENSPFPSILRKRGIEAYSHDLVYPPGVHDYLIGSSADCLPVENNWLNGASLQCAFEHFQGDIDSGFVRELARVLKPGGRCVIVPLYMASKLLNVYDPVLYSNWNNEQADNGAHVLAEVHLGGHFERYYSPESLKRILIPNIDLNYTIYRIDDAVKLLQNPSKTEQGQVNRIRYALYIQKRS